MTVSLSDIPTTSVRTLLVSDSSSNVVSVPYQPLVDVSMVGALGREDHIIFIKVTEHTKITCAGSCVLDCATSIITGTFVAAALSHPSPHRVDA